MAETELLAGAATPITNCSVYVQVWVDVSTNPTGPNPSGVYIVDNRTNLGSQNEGGLSLVTSCTKGNYIGFSAFTVDPNADATVSIASMGNSQAWGFTGQPQGDGQGNFIGQVQNSGTFAYEITINVGEGGGNTVQLNQVSLNVA